MIQETDINKHVETYQNGVCKIVQVTEHGIKLQPLSKKHNEIKNKFTDKVVSFDTPKPGFWIARNSELPFVDSNNLNLFQ